MSDRVTFVHTADLHLDAPFEGADAADDRVRPALLRATGEALDAIVDVCLRRGVDLLVIAGDVYNSRNTSYAAQKRFRDATVRLAEAGVSVFIARGNHDPAGGWSAGLDFPDTVHWFGTDAVERIALERDGEPLCALYGRSYATSAVKENLSLGYHRDPADRTAIGVLHCMVIGGGEHEAYSECSLSDLRTGGMDYWALGHVHKPGVLSEEGPRIVYPGSPQGLNPKETGTHGCWVVTMEGGRVLDKEYVETSQVVWGTETIDCSGMERLEEVREAVIASAESMRAAAGRPVVARIALTGRSAVHADLRREGPRRAGTVAEELQADLRDELVAGTPWVWVDRLRDLTRPAIDLDEVRAGADFAAEVVRVADDLLADPDAAAALVAGVSASVERELGGGLGLDAADVLGRARDECLDRLYRSGGAS